jgi:hypothetical protein
VLAYLASHRVRALTRTSSGAVYTADVSSMWRRHAGFIQLTASVDAARLEATSEQLTATLEAFRSTSVDGGELDAAKTILAAPQPARAAAFRIAHAIASGADDDDRRKRLVRLTGEDIRSAAARYLLRDKRCTLVGRSPATRK